VGHFFYPTGSVRSSANNLQWFELDLTDNATESPVGRHRATFSVGTLNFLFADYTDKWFCLTMAGS